MYSAVLMMGAMVAAPQQLPENGYGRDGGGFLGVRARMGARAEARASGGIFGLGAGLKSSGCAGVSSAAVVSSGCSGFGAKAYSSGCTGSQAYSATATQANAVVAPQQMGVGPVRRAFMRAELKLFVNRLEHEGKVSAADAARAKHVLNDSELRGMVMDHVDKRMGAGGVVAAAGGHPFLEWLMANWKEILEYILSKFGK